MTRFARAKGSKSSNEKTPEEATSWLEIKNSMLSKKLSKPEKLLLKKKTKIDAPKEVEWASLGNSNKFISLLKQHLDKKRNNKNTTSNSVDETKRKMPIKKVPPNKSEVDENKVKKSKKRKLEPDVNLEKSLTKKKKKLLKPECNSKSKVKKQTDENLTVKDSKFSQKKKTEKFENLKKEINKNSYSGVADKKSLKKFNEPPKEKKKVKKCFVEKFSSVEELIFNGKKIPIVKYQGYNVTLEDAERLEYLKNEMAKEKISKGKIDAAIKLERRRAEKALSRFKKERCFHCRGFGHFLANCPTLAENENTSVGICYKCGSGEHLAAECKVVAGVSFQFAECFICHEQGHIAKQCPDNPRGLYPQGGACRECGDVTHLRRNCPKVQTKKEEETITVGVTNDRDLECLDEEISNRKKQNLNKNVKKSATVKF